MQSVFMHNIFDVWFLLVLVNESGSAPIHIRLSGRITNTISMFNE